MTSTLTLTPPTWDVPGVAVSYQWYRGAAAVPGRTGLTYVVAGDDVGQAITARVTARKTGYADGVAISNAVNGFVAGAPAPLVAPSITGSAAAKGVLTVNAGTWSAAGTFTYQWLLDGQPVAKATGKTFTVARGVRRPVGQRAGHADRHGQRAGHGDQRARSRSPSWPAPPRPARRRSSPPRRSRW